jgi:hypothetical protein
MKEDSDWNVVTASLGHGRDGAFIELNERPMWALAAENIGEAITDHTFHLLCCNIPEWTAKIRWGKSADEDGYSVLYRFGSWLNLGFGAWKQYREIARIPVSNEWVREHYPDADPMFSEEFGPDEMRVKFDKTPDGE